MMTRRVSCLAAILFCLPAALIAADEARFMSYPDINGDSIIFSYDDDLWLTTIQGGIPIRITTHPGREFAARSDVLQDNDPASVMADKDLQLEKALEVVMKRIKDETFRFPPNR